jgi:hypothetical protein
VLCTFFVTLGMLLFKTGAVRAGWWTWWLGALVSLGILIALAWYFRKRATLISTKRTLAWSKPGAAVSPLSATGNPHGQGTEER